MAIDQIPEREVVELEPENSGRKFLVIFLVLAALAVGIIYALHQSSATRAALEAQQTQTQKQMRAEFNDLLNGRLTAMENSNAQQLDAVKDELNAAANRLGTTGGELKHARKMVAKLQQDEQAQADKLQAELEQKADQQQVGALNQDVSAQRTDLDSTKKDLETVRSDLGMARSEMGTLIARNHDDIDVLRKLGERDYFEFTAERNSTVKVGGVGLTLKKTNVKHHRFNMDMLADDVHVEKKDRTINEPIFFYVAGSKRPCELVVNEVKSNQVKGYISTPKGGPNVVASSGGGR